MQTLGELCRACAIIYPPKMAFAHSENSQGRKHDLVAHLKAVAELAANFAGKFDAAELGYWAGLWHDLGKFNPAFQEYLANPSPPRGPDHKSAGAILALSKVEGLVFVIAGHHGGLQDRGALKAWLREKASDNRTQDALCIARAELASLEPAAPLSLPSWTTSKIETEFFLRILFSALVDADFLDTERHFHPESSTKRPGTASLAELWSRFEVGQSALSGKEFDPVNRVRHQVYQACLGAAGLQPGYFRLTVPTGGGKTRSSLAFALRHALHHGMERVIVGVPYTSIIEQTVDVYQEILGDDVVLEHHSAVPQDDPENPAPEEVRRCLASENWDAPVIVTTTVQLFESLFANQTARCRKLHNIAKSVLILDEAQTLPTHLLEPVLDVLRQLVAHYGVSVVLCTATQPALEESTYLRGLPNVREIVPDPTRLFTELKRVRYEWAKDGQKISWQHAADEMRKEKQALAVVNTKADALALLDALDDPEALHLSTLLCGAHRRETLNKIRSKLEAGAPCRLVSTQVVECGVDLDFPLVLRALGPLDRIVQAAGRCNRDGKLPGLGRVVVFEPDQGKLPSGAYRTGTALAAMGLLNMDFDFDDPHAYTKYFQLLYQTVELDSKNIQELRRNFSYAEVGRRFRMIEDDTLPVIVRPPWEAHSARVDELMAKLEHREPGSRWLFRALQPYLVNVRSRLVPGYHKQGLIRQLTPNLWEWLGRYDAVRGLDTGNRPPEELVV